MVTNNTNDELSTEQLPQCHRRRAARGWLRRARGPQRRGVVAVEAAVVAPLLIILMLGMWEVGRLIQVNQILINSAREGARLAAGGYVNGTPVTSVMVTQSIRDYLTSAGLPAAAVSGAQINLASQASPNWINPSDALPLDRFQITVTIPSGAAFNSLRWNLLNKITSVSQMSVSVTWESLNDLKIVVDTQLPY